MLVYYLLKWLLFCPFPLLLLLLLQSRLPLSASQSADQWPRGANNLSRLQKSVNISRLGKQKMEKAQKKVI